MEDVSFQFLDTQEGVDALVEHLSKHDEVALDSEADNLHHFDTQLCLVQIKLDDEIYLLDVLAEVDLSAFWEELSKKHLIMHGADFDLRLFKEFTNFRAKSLFDSMLASQLLGIKQIGLAALLLEHFKVKLPKDSQKSDWSQRPLTEKMLRYAANDVLYLYELRDILMGRIRELGREEWLDQRCDNQINASESGFPEGDENSWRISKSDKLDARGQAALFELWHWRQDLAKRLDRPPFKVLGNNYILTLCEAVSEGNYEYVFEQLPMGIQRRKRQGLYDAILAGTKKDLSTLPKRPPRTDTKGPLSQTELDRQETIKLYRNKVAEELGIDPTLVATRSLVAQLARDTADRQGLMAWQQALLEPCLKKAEEG